MERRAHGFLKCVGTKDSDRTIELRGTEFTIGRRETCDVSYSDTMLSAVHCKLVYFEHHPKQDDSWWLEDCSSNGTYLNGTLVGKGTLRCLERGDSISLLLPKPGAAELPRYSYTFARLPSSDDAQRAGMFSEASVNLKVEDAVKRAVLLADVERKKAIADAVERTKQEHEHERRMLLEKAAATATETERTILARAQAQAQAASREHTLALETALASAEEKATQRFMAALSAVREQARGDSAAMLEAHEREAEAHRLAMSQMEERLATSEAEVSRLREAQAAAVEAALAEQRERLETIAQEACASMRAALDDEKAAAVTRAVSSARAEAAQHEMSAVSSAVAAAEERLHAIHKAARQELLADFETQKEAVKAGVANTVLAATESALKTRSLALGRVADLQRELDELKASSSDLERQLDELKASSSEQELKREQERVDLERQLDELKASSSEQELKREQERARLHQTLLGQVELLCAEAEALRAVLGKPVRVFKDELRDKCVETAISSVLDSARALAARLTHIDHAGSAEPAWLAEAHSLLEITVPAPRGD
jgi:DNA repair exonuclease SbcCD ATPase subunit